jgi:HPr kinase/phosphorylase
MSLLLHGTCVAWPEGAVLIRGESGSGKSDLALRLLDLGAELVADDQVVLEAKKGQVIAHPPENLAGLLEVRGIGILAIGHKPAAPLKLVIDLVQEDRVERMPEPQTAVLLDVELPLYRLSPWPASAPSKVRLAMRTVCGSIISVS